MSRRMRELLLPWDVQPQGEIEVDLAHPVFDGVALPYSSVLLPRNGVFKEFLSGSDWTFEYGIDPTGWIYDVPEYPGEAIVFAGKSGVLASKPEKQITTATSLLVVLPFYIDTSWTYPRGHLVTWSSTANDGDAARSWVYVDRYGGNNYVNVLIQETAYSNITEVTATLLRDKGTIAFFFETTGTMSTLSVFQDGELLGTATGSTTTTPQYIPRIGIPDWHQGIYNYGMTMLIGAKNGVEHARELSRNPWSVFKPRRILVPSASNVTNPPISIREYLIPWTSQPQEVVSPARWLPEGSDVVCAYNFRPGTAFRINHNLPIEGGFGVSTTSSSGYIYSNLTRYPQPGNFTFLAEIFIRASALITTVNIFGVASSLNSKFFKVYITTSKQIVLDLQNTSSNYIRYSTDNDAVISFTRCAIGIQISSDMLSANIFINGIPQNVTITTLGSYTVPADYPLNRGAWLNVAPDIGSNPTSGSNTLALSMGAMLPFQHPDLRSLTLNPWQLFEGLTIRVPYYTSFASFGTPALSNTTAYNITSTTFSVRVNITYP